MLAEQLEIVRRIWSKERFDFEEEFYTLVCCVSAPSPVSRPLPRLIVGGREGEQTMTLAARWADEFNTVFASLDVCKTQRARLDEISEKLGKDPATISMSLMTGVVFGESAADVERRSREIAIRQGYSDEKEFLEAVENSWIVGTADQIVECLMQLEEAGISRVMLQHLLLEDSETLEGIGELVVPQLRS